MLKYQKNTIMKIAVWACLSFLCFATIIDAQQTQIESFHGDIDYDKNVNFSCGWQGESALHLKDFRSEAEAITVMEDIVAFTGLSANFKIQAAKVPNAAAVVYGQERYVFYNPRFMQEVEDVTNTNWASISILAHEIGHHLDGHTLKDGGSRPDMEIRADEFSGFILRKMGASLAEAQAAMRRLASPKGSATHPARDTRLSAIEKGWRRADEQIARYTSSTRVPTNNPVDDEPVASNDESETTSNNNTSADEAPTFAAYKVSIHTNADKLYYITTRGSFITIRSGAVSQLGKLVATKNDRFPYKIVFDDKRIGDLLINRKGELYNAKTQVVGQLSRVEHNFDSTKQPQTFAFKGAVSFLDLFESDVQIGY